MRTFIAIEIPEAIKKGMADVQRSLKSSGVDASWSRPEGIHLTLKFLGEIADEKVPSMVSALTTAVSGVGAFRLEIKGVGAFPNPKNARVVWIGVSGDADTLSRLQAAVEDSMSRIGVERDERTFTPHLTLGRIKYLRAKESWLNALDAVKDVKLPGFDVNAVSLMKSELKRTGAVYTELAKVELAA
jgi:2'-5' RNA ligase